MPRPLSVCRLLLAAAAAAIVGACGTTLPPAHLYVLNRAPEPPTPARSAGGNHLAVAVAATSVPEYLDRMQLVRRVGGNGLLLLDGEQWGERPSVNISRALAQDLAALLPAQVTLLSTGRMDVRPDYTIALALDDFEIDQSGAAVLAGRWTIKDSRGSVVASRAVVLRTPKSAPGTPGAVAAMADNVEAVARQVTASIASLHGG